MHGHRNLKFTDCLLYLHSYNLPATYLSLWVSLFLCSYLSVCNSTCCHLLCACVRVCVYKKAPNFEMQWHLFRYSFTDTAEKTALYLLGWLVAGFSPRGPDFDPRPFYIRFVVNKVTLGQVLPQVRWFSRVSIILPLLHIHTSMLIICHRPHLTVGNRDSR